MQASEYSRADHLKDAVTDARNDYQLDCELIHSAGLDEDEQEVALTHAKRRLVERLYRILQ